MRCVVCGDVITQPVGPERLAMQMATWLWEKRPDMRLVSELYELAEDAAARDGPACLFTKLPMGVCSHCFTRHVHDWVSGTLPELAQEFLERFTFSDERHEFVAQPVRLARNLH